MSTISDPMQPVISPVIDEELAQATLETALADGGDFAEVFAEDRNSVSGFFDDGKVESFSSGSAKGVGIRVISGNSTGFAHTTDLSKSGLMSAAATAAKAVRNTGADKVKTIALSHSEAPRRNEVRTMPEQISKKEKARLLEEANEAARTEGAGIAQVACTYGDKRRRITVANSEGVFASDDQVRTFFSVVCVAAGDGGMQTGRETIGHTVGFELFENYNIDEISRTAAKRALSKLNARPAPSGSMPVVVGKGGGGVLFHEACGHGLEADAIEKSASTFAGKMDTQVASPLITLIDDGTVAGEWGCYGIDDEGYEAQYNVLIQDGELVEYMWDGLRARNGNRQSSGNGRRQGYEYLPMVRMTNTYIQAGETDPEDIISDTSHGVYVAQLGGGQVNTATGDFVFGMTEAYLIEDGKLKEPIREGNLIGNGPQVLQNIDALGNDFAFGSPGTCGKDGQGVPVGDGTPTLRVTNLTVGGTAAD